MGVLHFCVTEKHRTLCVQGKRTAFQRRNETQRITTIAPPPPRGKFFRKEPTPVVNIYEYRSDETTIPLAMQTGVQNKLVSTKPYPRWVA